MNYSLTNPQNSIWLTEKFFKGTSVNNICGYVYIKDEVNFDVLKKAINELVKTNDSMRFKFTEEKNTCMQSINEFKEFDIETFDFSFESDIEKKALEMANVPFNFEANSLFKFILFKFPNNSGGFIVNVHHIISDSWTLGLIAKEVTGIYLSILNNTYEEKQFPSYTNYIINENEYINSEKYIKDKAYWDEVFTTVPEVASIPSMKDNKNIAHSCKGAREKFIVPETEISKIKEFCTINKISIYNFFMAVYSIYLGKVSNLDDFVIGTPILNRTNFEQKHTMGMFISTAPLRINLDSTLSFIDFSKNIASSSMSLLRHQRYPYQAILEDLRKKDANLPNLYNVVLSYQITKTIEEENNIRYSTDWVFNGNCADELQIHLFDLHGEDSMTVAYDYKADKYDSQDIRDLHSRILTIIKQVIDCNDILLKNIEIVTPEEKHKILYEFNNTKVDYPRDKTIVDLFEEQVEKTPDNIAVVFEDQKLTYRELNEKSNQLASYLIENHISNKDVVALFLDKSLEVIISIIATLKVGATYLPLDIDYPKSRIDYILDNSKSKIILTTHSENEITSNIPIAYVDYGSNIYTKPSNFENNFNIKTSDLAYITYTSGSTGNPKGVMIKHQNVVRLVKNTNYITFSSNDIILQTGSIVFDASTFEIFGALLNGLSVYLMKKENLLNPTLFEKYIIKNNITTLFLTTALFNKFCEFNPKMFNKLKYLLTGGEAVSYKYMKMSKLANPNLKLLHVYGPTENTTFSTYYPVNNNLNIFPIGKPIANSTAYVVNKYGNFCPIGIPGELWVGGDGVAKGYLNNETLTNEKFIKNCFQNETIYKTGDLVTMLPDGNIEFIGRIDNQVKIRGFRIELSEIDSNILKYSNIKQAISVIQNINNTKTICSYIVSDENIDINKLKAYLSKTLATYMIPTYIMQLDNFPLNINGKIDRKLLPFPSVNETERNIVAPRNEIDTAILNNLKNILSTGAISIEDNLFNIGLDSLSAITLSSNISKELNIKITVKDIFEYPTIKELSDYISTLSQTINIITIPKAEKLEYYPLSSAQKRIYYASSMDNNSTLYNIAGGIILDKALDINKLQECFDILIQRHSVLRTAFEIKENDIVQIVKEKIHFKLEIDNCDNIEDAYSNFVKPFDLSKAPLFKAKITKLENQKMLLLIDMHHIISDGTSLSILIQELCDLYNDNELSDKQIDYTDFTLWEKEQFENNEFKTLKDYWVNQFKDEIPLLNMPSTYSRPSIQSFEGSNYYTNLPKETFDKIENISKKLGITPYMLMLSCYYILLSRYTSQDDIVIGTPIVGRELPELSNVLGMFVNTLALRNKIDNNLTFNKFTNLVKKICLDSFKYQNFPFNELVKELNISRDSSRNPLFDVMFIYQNNGYPEISFNDIKAEYFIPDNNISKFDLSLEVIPLDNEYSLRFEYCTKLFNEKFIQRLSIHYINILNAILENNEVKIADIDMLSEKEKNQILYEFNNTKLNYQKDKTIIDLFEEQVEKTPNNIAVIFEDKKLTYRELNEKANGLARYLIENGITNNSIVGIMVPRSLEMIVAMFGILKSGAAYLPLDPTYPKNRIEYILKDSNVKLLLTKDSAFNLNNIETIDISIDKSEIYKKYSLVNLNNKFSSSSLAYVIYTSGSTGNPKGVAITHQNVNNFIEGVISNIKFDNVIVSITTICFDIFVLESILPLQKGLTVVLANEEEQTIPQLLNELCLKNNVTMIQTTPSKFSLLTSDENSLEFIKNMKTIMLGGEPFPNNLLQKIRELSSCKIYNMYGPTETTVWSSIKDLTNSKNITIGTPIANTTMYILDNNLNVVPIGMAGTLYIGGDGLSAGYLNREELTNEKFILNPHNSEKIYNTGDLAKWTENGELICLGRSDFQVKIRGLRIELEEIEKAILSFKGIEKAVVSVNTDSLNRQVLCAYFTSKLRVSVSELKQYLGMFLPNYMLPTYIIQLNDFKYTPNGKIDKKALPVPDFTTERKRVILPKTETENKISKIWENLLCISPISTADNFFEIGGDSLVALKMQIELLKQNINVSYAEIFKYNTIKKLSALIDEKSNTSDLSLDIYANYDYSNINQVLNNNIISNLSNLSASPIGNVLLTGVTGFLGAHILDYLMKNTSINVYCLVRKDHSITLLDKVLNKLHFYFGEIYDDLINKRIFIINSDLEQDKLGLSDEKIQTLSNKISCVINSAALVKHYGDYKDFESVNVTSVKKLIDFCKKYNKKLIQISTISVSGNTLTDLAINTNNFTSNVEFNESNLYIGQSLENVYVRSKFEAEKIILEEINKGTLNSLILRIGNITHRSSDGKFQSNSTENAFANKIKAFLEIGCIPEYLLDKYIEFSPVDLVAEAVVRSIEYLNKKISVLHIYNENHIYINNFINMLPSKYKLNILNNTEFKNIILDMLKNDEKKYIISHILNDMDEKHNLVYETNIKIKNDMSKTYLNKIGFNWPEISKKYITNFINNLEG